jgi:hypothetical protein
VKEASVTEQTVCAICRQVLAPLDWASFSGRADCSYGELSIVVRCCAHNRVCINGATAIVVARVEAFKQGEPATVEWPVPDSPNPVSGATHGPA